MSMFLIRKKRDQEFILKMQVEDKKVTKKNIEDREKNIKY